jgi:hypothetical protein
VGLPLRAGSFLAEEAADYDPRLAPGEPSDAQCLPDALLSSSRKEALKHLTRSIFMPNNQTRRMENIECPKPSVAQAAMKTIALTIAPFQIQGR